MIPRKVVMFFNGTWSTHKEIKDPSGITAIAYKIMRNPTNSIVEMFNNCEEENKYIFDGPGTDILDEEDPSILRAITGGLFGTHGNYSIHENVKKAKETLLREYKQGNGAPLEIHLFGWSRGGFTTWLVKKALKELIDTNQIKANKIHIHSIDPVPGGPNERKVFADNAGPDPEAEGLTITSSSYYSTTGNVEPLDRYGLNRLMNMKFFSAKLDDTKDAKTFIFEGNHEDLCGHARAGNDQPKKAVGDIVLGHIVAESSMQGLSFNSKWKSNVYYDANHNLADYALSPKIPPRRCFLSTGSWFEKYLGTRAKFIKSLISPPKKMFTKLMELDRIKDELLEYINFNNGTTPQPYQLGGTIINCDAKYSGLISEFNHAYDKVNQLQRSDDHQDALSVQNEIFKLRKKLNESFETLLMSKLHQLFISELPTFSQNNNHPLIKEVKNAKTIIRNEYIGYQEKIETFKTIRNVFDNRKQLKNQLEILKEHYLNITTPEPVKHTFNTIENYLVLAKNAKDIEMINDLINGFNNNQKKIDEIKTKLHLTLTKDDLEFWSQRVTNRLGGTTFINDGISYTIPHRIAKMYNTLYPISQEKRIEKIYYTKEFIIEDIDRIRNSFTFSFSRSQSARELYTAKDITQFNFNSNR